MRVAEALTINIMMKLTSKRKDTTITNTMITMKMVVIMATMETKVVVFMNIMDAPMAVATMIEKTTDMMKRRELKIMMKLIVKLMVMKILVVISKMMVKTLVMTIHTVLEIALLLVMYDGGKSSSDGGVDDGEHDENDYGGCDGRW